MNVQGLSKDAAFKNHERLHERARKFAKYGALFKDICTPVADILDDNLFGDQSCQCRCCERKGDTSRASARAPDAR